MLFNAIGINNLYINATFCVVIAVYIIMYLKRADTIKCLLCFVSLNSHIYRFASVALLLPLPSDWFVSPSPVIQASVGNRIAYKANKAIRFYIFLLKPGHD